MSDQRNLNLRLQIQTYISCFLKQARRNAGLSLEDVHMLLDDEDDGMIELYEEGVVSAKAFAKLMEIYDVPVFEAQKFLENIYLETVR